MSNSIPLTFIQEWKNYRIRKAQHALTSVSGETAMAALKAARDMINSPGQESEFLALRPIEQVVLWRLLEQGSRFRPYDAEVLKFYREKLNAPGKAVV